MSFNAFLPPLSFASPPLSSATNGQDAYFLNVLYELSPRDVALYLTTVEQLLNVAVPVDAGTQTIEAWLVSLGPTKRDPVKRANLIAILRKNLSSRLRMIADTLVDSSELHVHPRLPVMVQQAPYFSGSGTIGQQLPPSFSPYAPAYTVR